MSRAGRKRKAGKRTASGQLSRAKGSIVFDQGSPRTRDKFSVYGQDGSDAIGRAYHHGLLGDDGLNLRNAGRRVFRAYWPMFAVGRVQTAIGDKSGHANDDELLDRDQRERRIAAERWLADTLRMVDRMGRETRRAFDQLVININPDEGPAWLDSIIWHRARGVEPVEADMKTLAKALEPLSHIANGRR